MRLPSSYVVATTGLRIALTLLAIQLPGSADAQRAGMESWSASQPVPLSTRWPSTTAIGIVGRSNPATVEATSDGWVVLTPLGRWNGFSELPPRTRLQLPPETVRKWTKGVRSALALPPDTALKADSPSPIPQLGRGLARLGPAGALRIGVDKRISFQVARCDGGGSYLTLSPDELTQLSDMLDRAAKVAVRSSPRPVPPTLGRPYYESELTCSATAMAGNDGGRFPSEVPATQRRYVEIGVRFVVDTAGIVERGSIAFLPGTPGALERATRELLARWRYRPAMRGGAPVRQVIATAVVFDPERTDVPAPSPRVSSPYVSSGYGLGLPYDREGPVPQHTFLSTDDGWVRIRLGAWTRAGAFAGPQEWFVPDSVESWAARALAYLADDSARVRRQKSYAAGRAAVLAHPSRGNSYEVRYLALAQSDTVLTPWAQMGGCSGASLRGEIVERGSIERYLAAARAARAQRSTPREPTDGANRRGEVACQALLPPLRALQDELEVWRVQRGPIPPSMESRNARAEVLTSFVVDAEGVPKPSTLVAMPGSDPRAVAALRASLDRYRFTPATRAGVPVSAVVMRNWSFEPRPRCRDIDDGLDCPRVYSQTSRR